ncbi:urea ABC transporter, ATP-binding protein UrtE [Opitutaceae bacterium TAV1]|nr:urea ABC transporter, ATP-binding protein UrtE [Opitutaceae bacterium TAV1]
MFTVSQLQVGYGQSRVIQDISFQVGDSEILAIMGRNGMGKSTLLKSLVGVHPSYASGSIRLDDTELAPLSSCDRVRKGIAYVPQGRMIFPFLTVYENMISGARGEVQKSVFDEIYLLFPVLYEMRKRKGGNLSGGQQQQLAIARALVTNPRVLVLDEPTEGIQPSIIKDIARVLRQIRDMRKIAIIVTEQVVSFMMDVCDRAIVIERGRFVHEAPRSSLDADRVKQLLAV